jgi:hypothetical protein
MRVSRVERLLCLLISLHFAQFLSTFSSFAL